MVKHLWWRIGVPVVGLAIAVAVGWRLSPDVTGLVVVCAWLPLGAWCLFAPRSPAALPIALVLLAAIATIRWTLPGHPGDRSTAIAWSVLMWYPIPGGLALLIATWRGNRAAAERPMWLRTISTVAAGAALTLGCGCGGVLRGQLGPPSPSELLPLPPGMIATSTTGPDGADGCDQTGHACWRYYRITGVPGDSTAVLVDRLRRHLRETKGWGAAVAGLSVPDGTATESCRPLRRLAAADLCVALTSDPAATTDHPAIGVELSMAEPDRSRTA